MWDLAGSLSMAGVPVGLYKVAVTHFKAFQGDRLVALRKATCLKCEQLSGFSNLRAQENIL